MNEINKINNILSDFHNEINNLNSKIRDCKDESKEHKLNIKKLNQLQYLSNGLIKYKSLLLIKFDD